MKYFTSNRVTGSKKQEISKEEVKRLLGGWWEEDSIDKILEEESSFRMHTPYADVWTETEDGMVPMPGFYGVVGE